MAYPKTIRFLGVASVILFIWLVLQVFRSDGGAHSLGKIEKMEKDPLLDGTLLQRPSIVFIADCG